MSLTVGEHSVRHIRNIVRSLLHDWGRAELTDAVELGVTELVTNVVRHVPDRRCVLLVQRRRAVVRVEVTDGSPELPLVSFGPALDREGGRGLVLVDAVADKWGVEPRPGGGKTVWFECGTGPSAP
ncbi:ATP-binding protein [Streptomyces sp. NPDC006012]|uniref:ATP-binding protein n=1 Tax=Streptomyces sp. NPDC006012 TaxID=3364739 RepID=UPI003697C4D5